jgi:uncharacterized FlaG/YvyC family protein
MALEVISNAKYHDHVNTIQKPVSVKDTSLQNNGAINVLEMGTTAKTSSSYPNGSNLGIGQRADGAISEEQLKNALTKANNHMKPHRTRFEFDYHEETKRVSIKVIDKETEETIREIPPEKALKMLEKLWEIAGFLVDERR